MNEHDRLLAFDAGQLDDKINAVVRSENLEATLSGGGETAKHSPLPWKWGEHIDEDYFADMLDVDGKCVMTAADVGQVDISATDATFITQAANSHDALVSACEETHDRLSDPPLQCRTPEERLAEFEGWIDNEILPVLEAALAKASEGE